MTSRLVSRRAFALGLCALPVAPVTLVGCGKPQTPLAHLHGKGWVHGAYEYYGKGYRDLQAGTELRSFEAYRVLAQKGVTSLDALQSREVPFHIRVEQGDQRFAFEREVPERLMFRADMAEADRQAATAAWEKAREHIHTDYAEIRRLEWALTRLLQQLQQVRATIDETRREQFRLTRQAGEVQGGQLPFELPYQVTPKDYEIVLYLLIERLEDDRQRLEALEGTILTVGLTVRATDAGSASLAANIRKVLLAVVEDTKDEPRPITFPATEGERDELLARGRELSQAIARSPEYAAWIKEEQDRAIDQVGMVFSLIDQFTGLPTSAIYRTAVDIWRGNDDYLAYVKTLVKILPAGREVAKALDQAVALTEKARDVIATGEKGLAIAKKAVALGKKGLDVDRGDVEALSGALGGALLNTGTKYAKGQLNKQLAFFENEIESTKVAQALRETGLMTEPLPKAADLVDEALE